MTSVTWLDEPEDHDYPAAASYLSLITTDDVVTAIVADLRRAPTVRQKAKDILRAARLDLLPRDNVHVASDLRKIEKDHSLSPILLLRGDVTADRPLHIADGYHRVCASYHVDENTDIPCRVAGFDPPDG